MERRLAELHKRRQYSLTSPHGNSKKIPSNDSHPKVTKPRPEGKTKKCWNCDRVGHMAYNCPQPKRESHGKPNPRGNAKMVSSNIMDDPVNYLLSDSDESGEVRVQDHGSAPRRAKVSVEGVPMLGVIDTAADVTIMGGEMFKQVATVAKLHKRDFKPVDKTPYNYDGRPFRLDGRVQLDITFQDHTINTTVYIKMDASEQLLLSEGVCRQLEIVTYHPEVQVDGLKTTDNVRVPAVKVQLVHGVTLPPKPDQSVVAEVKWEPKKLQGPLLLEVDPGLQANENVQITSMYLPVVDSEKGIAKVVLTNNLGFTQTLEQGRDIGLVTPVTVVEYDRMSAKVRMVSREKES